MADAFKILFGRVSFVDPTWLFVDGHLPFLFQYHNLVAGSRSTAFLKRKRQKKQSTKPLDMKQIIIAIVVLAVTLQCCLATSAHANT